MSVPDSAPPARRPDSRDPGVVLALTTVPTTTDAGAFARDLVDARMVACASVLPVQRSVYWWDGTVEEAEETTLLLKTTADMIPLLREHLSSHHPYDVPELLVFEATDGLPSYLAWVRGEVARG